MKRVIVCGGRDFDDRDFVFKTLDELQPVHGFFCVVQGGCPTGADALAREWCRSRLVEFMNYPVTKEEWRTIGRKAGPLRNQRMIDDANPDGCIAFPGGNGTADMVRRAKTHHLNVIEMASPKG